MRKNGSKMISIGQYRLADLFLFAVILVIAGLLAFYAPKLFPENADFTFSLMVPIALLVIMRWGWCGIFYAIGDGLLLCLLNLGNENFIPALFGVYIIGNAFIAVTLLLAKFIGKERIASKWYLSALFVSVGWLSVFLGRACAGACFGLGFVTMMQSQLWDLLSLAVGLALILLLRRLDGMFEDQKHYLLRLDKEKRDKMRRDTFGDELVEIDAESLSILNKKDNDLY